MISDKFAIVSAYDKENKVGVIEVSSITNFPKF